MSTVTRQATIHFPEGYDERREYETPSRGYLSHVIVQLEDGARYQLFFIDPVRLQQELADDVRSGHEFFAEPNMIVLPEVTTGTIHKAVEGLLREKYFGNLKPL